MLAKGVIIIALVIASAKWVVPHVLYQIARTGNRELFLLSIVLICMRAVAWLTAQTGLSLALGAFLAGLIVSETEYSHRAFGNILPFRDVFASFFISIGMLLDVDFLLKHPGIIALLTLGVLLVKAVLAGSAALFLKFPLRTAVLVGLALCQVGSTLSSSPRWGKARGYFPVKVINSSWM